MLAPLRTGLALLVTCLAPGLAASVGPAPAQETAADDLSQATRLELEALDGSVRPRDASLGALTDPREEGAAIVRFVRPRESASVAPAPTRDVAQVTLAGGDRLTGRIAGGDGDQLFIDLGGAVLPLRIDLLRSVVFPARVPDDGSAAPRPADGLDALYVITGGSLDRAQGLVEGFADADVSFEDERAGSRSFPWSRVAALFVSPLDDGDAGADTGDERAPVVVGLVGGGRLSGRLVTLDASRVTLTRPGADAAIELPAAHVTEVALDDGSFRFLSDLPVADPGAQSLFGDDLGFTWPHRVDRAVDGGPLRVAGRVEARGIGVHAPSRLTWELDGGWRTLRLAGGVDDSGTGGDRGGTVRFRVLADGRELWSSDVRRAGQAPVSSGALDVSGARTLVLEVDPVDDFVLDRADWLRPILVRADA